MTACLLTKLTAFGYDCSAVNPETTRKDKWLLTSNKNIRAKKEKEKES